MPAFIALLRAVNVGGTGRLPMADLKAMSVAAGYLHVQTYIASGNLVFVTNNPPANPWASWCERPGKWRRFWPPTHFPKPRPIAPSRFSSMPRIPPMRSQRSKDAETKSCAWAVAK
jgi:hypothetical protein